MVREDALMGIAAPLPVLSGGLRSRVLAAAAEARARRAQGRRVFTGVVSLFLLLGCVGWLAPCLPSVRRDLRTDPALAEGTSAGNSSASSAPARATSFSRRETFIAAMGDDWRMVEAEFQSREEFTRRVQM